jgi:hypothetical protein
MIEIYVTSETCKEEDYMDIRYNSLSCIEHVEKLYPDIFLPEIRFEMQEMWKFYPKYVPYMYISEKMKPFFEEYFSDSGYFIGGVIEFHPRPQVGKVIRGYYKWVVNYALRCRKKNEKNYIAKSIEHDIFAVYHEENLAFYYYGFSEKAIQILLDKGLWNLEFEKYKLYLEGEDND